MVRLDSRFDKVDRIFLDCFIDILNPYVEGCDSLYCWFAERMGGDEKEQNEGLVG
jgi:hypothetical protein